MLSSSVCHSSSDSLASSYHPEAAADAWPRALEWFRKYL
ncbi:MAG: hypothetical protein D6791_05355 [Chloroflexi bacterium]|nr:MAG: hypothetical protein D6791_05355 [Chloroflexota bacterium]